MADQSPQLLSRQELQDLIDRGLAAKVAAATTVLGNRIDITAFSAQRYSAKDIAQFVNTQISFADDVSHWYDRSLRDMTAEAIAKLPPWEQALLLHQESPLVFGSGDTINQMRDNNVFRTRRTVLGFYTSDNNTSYVAVTRPRNVLPLSREEVMGTANHEWGHGFDWGGGPEALSRHPAWEAALQRTVQRMTGGQAGNPANDSLIDFVLSYAKVKQPKEAFAEMTAIFNRTYAVANGDFARTDATMEAAYPELWQVYRAEFIPDMMRQARMYNPVLDMGNAARLLKPPGWDGVRLPARTPPPGTSEFQGTITRAGTVTTEVGTMERYLGLASKGLTALKWTALGVVGYHAAKDLGNHDPVRATADLAQLTGADFPAAIDEQREMDRMALFRKQHPGAAASLLKLIRPDEPLTDNADLNALIKLRQAQAKGYDSVIIGEHGEIDDISGLYGDFGGGVVANSQPVNQPLLEEYALHYFVRGGTLDAANQKLKPRQR